MAKPTTDSFGNFKIWVGDGASPEVFTAPCGFTTKSLNLEADASTANIADCDNPEEPAWEEAGVTVKRATVQGAGVMAEESYETWRAWWDSGAAKNVRVEKNLGYWEGPAICLGLGESVALGSDGNKIQLSVNLRNSTEWTWVPAA
jgi:hypothetical protein